MIDFELTQNDRKLLDDIDPGGLRAGKIRSRQIGPG